MATYLRQLSGPQRSALGNQRLGRLLAFTAGAINAGGYLVVRQYTSHMSGIVSSIADNLAVGALEPVLLAAAALAAFLAGAACCSLLVNAGRRLVRHSLYALPLLVEASLISLFAVLSAAALQRQAEANAALVALLCFMMGFQNAIITKISRAEIRTTHVTGLVTDIGIELGRGMYGHLANGSPGQETVQADRAKLRLLASLLGMFFTGAVAGALGFKHLGGMAALLPAALLAVAAAVPMADDLALLLQRK